MDEKSTNCTRYGHGHCLLCGVRNPLSLGLSFSPNGDGVSAEFEGHAGLQGYDGILHGGVIAALLDAAMTHCLFGRGIRALTADLRVRYIRPIPYWASLTLHARVIASTAPLFRLKADLRYDRQLMASAEAQFMQNRG